MYEIILDNIKINYKYILSFRARRPLLKICLNKKTNKHFIQIVVPYSLLKKDNFNFLNNFSDFNKIIEHLSIFNNTSQSNCKSDINILDNKYSKIRKDLLVFLISKKKWILKSLVELNLNKKININNDLNIDSREHFLKHKAEALVLCNNKVRYWSEKMGKLKFNNIKVKKVKTRWGSCSSKLNLNFNYKILFLEKKDQDYLIVHELSHLVHMNHSKAFWDLVCKTLGDKKYYRYKIK